MLNAELARGKGKCPSTKWQKRNIETLKLQGTTLDQLRRIAQQKELLQVKMHQAKKLIKAKCSV